MLIPQQNELEGFEVTKDIFGIASEFTLGIASLLSGDPLTAFDLHQSAYREASEKIDVDDNSPEVLKRYKARLVKCLVLSGLHATQVYYKSKQHGYLDKMEHYLNVIQDIDPGNYDAHLIRAILLFIRDHDIEGARQEIKKAKNERNAAWQYSEAFLAACQQSCETPPSVIS
jgi:superfamily I DNA and/or RNA helicase